MKLKPIVGQPLWYSNEFRPHREVIVSKIGSKWIYFDCGKKRCDFDGQVDEDFGRCYQTKSEYEATCALESEWKRLREAVINERLAPSGMTLEKIKQARAWLFGGEK